MTDENTPRVDAGESSRRSFMKKSAAGVASAALVGSGVGTAVAQDDGGGVLDEGWKGLIFTDNFHPQARFTFVSGVTEWTPNFGEVQDNWFSGYDTRMIRWLNTGEVVPLFVAQDANVGEYDQELGFVTDVDDDPNQPQLFEMDQEWTPFGDSPRLITVNVSPVPEEEEDNILEDEDWWQDAGAEGTPTNETATTTAGNETAENATTAGNETTTEGSLFDW